MDLRRIRKEQQWENYRRINLTFLIGSNQEKFFSPNFIVKNFAENLQIFKKFHSVLFSKMSFFVSVKKFYVTSYYRG